MVLLDRTQEIYVANGGYEICTIFLLAECTRCRTSLAVISG